MQISARENIHRHLAVGSLPEIFFDSHDRLRWLGDVRVAECACGIPLSGPITAVDRRKRHA